MSSLPGRAPDGLRERYRRLLLHAWDRPTAPGGACEGLPIARQAGAVREVEATIGFEPMNKGFADPRVRPLRHVAAVGGASPPSRSGWLPLEDSNLG